MRRARTAPASGISGTSTESTDAPAPEGAPRAEERILVPSLIVLLAAHPIADTTKAARAPDGRWALALSGGLARGIAHVGVLRALEEQGLRPDVVVGTSMGALVGGLWASGRSSRAIQRMFHEVDVQSLFEPHPSGFEWRRNVLPRPWLTILGAGGILRLPTGMLDDGFLNDLLARHLLDADALARGDFDRLPIPWRVIATDLELYTPAVIDSGSAARAVRASVSMPVVFAAMPDGERLLADGGLASHLPMLAAQAESVAHILGVDVRLRTAKLDAHSSVLRLGGGMFQQLTQRGRLDARPGRDTVLWLAMPGISPADFRLVDELVEAGYREARPLVARLAREWHLEAAPRPDSQVTVAPPRSLEWIRPDGRTARRTAAARALFGPLPGGPVDARLLGRRLERVYRGDLFRAAWPRFRTDAGADGTALSFDVEEHPGLEVTGVFAYERDRGPRGSMAAIARPVAGTWPAALVAGGVLHRFGGAAFGSLEPRSLARGAAGPFVRGGARRTETRIFRSERDWIQIRTERVELLAGGQVALPSGDVVQVGVGPARIGSRGRTAEGALAALRVQAPGQFARSLDASFLGGPDRYATARATLAVEVPLRLLTIRPAARGGWATEDAPLDEWQGLGGPSSLAGLRGDEWLGRRALAVELRLLRRIVSAVETHVAVQLGRVDDAIGGGAPGRRARFAGAAGARFDIPFGPLQVDGGWTEGGRARVDFSLGQQF